MSGRFSHFSQASDEWDLQQLYADIRSVQQSAELTPRVKQIIRGLLCGYTPQEIAQKIYNKPTANCIGQDLNKIYSYVQDVTEGEDRVISGNIVRLTSEAGYRQYCSSPCSLKSSCDNPKASDTPQPTHLSDWIEPDSLPARSPLSPNNAPNTSHSGRPSPPAPSPH
jgi:hypothetical protein